MIYTSYFAKFRYYKRTMRGVSIALRATFWEEATFPQLAPTKELLDYWMNLAPELKCQPEYELKYKEIYKREVLDKLDVHETYKLLDGKVLLCFEGSNSFCHRHIVREWFESHGYKCRELE